MTDRAGLPDTAPGGRQPSALAAAIHSAPPRGVFAVTGGGAGLLAELLTAPGASATVLEAHVPYAARSLAEFLGGAPEQACSAAAARSLAMRSFLRARALGGDFGFAVTAALATTRRRRGADRAHLAFQDAARTRAWAVAFPPGRSRREQEAELARVGLSAVAFALGLAEAPDLPAVEAAGGALAAVVLGERSHLAGGPFDAVLPGAFNPLHDGHRAMRADASRRLGAASGSGARVAFELSVANVDKPPLDYVELRQRLAQFATEEVVVTNAPTFVAKAHAVGGVVFVVGVDTLARIGAARYYGGAQAGARAFGEMRELGCSFLVYGRVMDGQFATLDDLALPPELAAMCVGVPEADFRADVSSTALRERERGQAL